MKYKRCMSFSLVFVAITSFLGGISVGQSPLAHLKVTSTRRATETEQPRRSAYTAEKWIVRFRLEISADQGAYLLVLGPKGSTPLGYALERLSGNIVWQDTVTGRGRPESPGIARLANEPGARWIFLPPSAAYEWEIVTEYPETQADKSRSVFVRKDMTCAATEVVSPWYSLDRR